MVFAAVIRLDFRCTEALGHKRMNERIEFAAPLLIMRHNPPQKSLVHLAVGIYGLRSEGL